MAQFEKVVESLESALKEAYRAEHAMQQLTTGEQIVLPVSIYDAMLELFNATLAHPRIRYDSARMDLAALRISYELAAWNAANSSGSHVAVPFEQYLATTDFYTMHPERKPS